MDWTQLPVFALAVLASWLGLSLLLRDPRDRVIQLFAWLSLHLTVYGLATALAPLTAAAGTARALLSLQAVESVLLPPVFLHFIVELTRDGRIASWARAALALSYLAGAGMAAYALAGPGMMQEPDILRFPAGPLTIAWVGQRALPLLLALALVGRHVWRGGGDDLARRRRLLLAVSALVGVSGALVATVASELRASPAFGHALMAAALVVLGYAVLVYRSLLPERLARRAVYRSMVGGALTAGYVALIMGLAPRLSAALQVDGPLVGSFMLAVVLAVAAPLRDWVSSQLDRLFFHREFDYGQLLRSFGEDLLERGALPEQLSSALDAICATLGIAGGLVALRFGDSIQLAALYGDSVPESVAAEATHVPPAETVTFGTWAPWPAARLLLPLRSGEQTLGVLALGPKRSGEPFRDSERALLSSLATYLALAVRHDLRKQEEQLALAVLAEQARQLQAEQTQLLERAAESTRDRPAEAARTDSAMHVYALGPLRVERDSAPIERWGGDKAGTYQAEALFAFLFDRRGRGLTKDEAAEVIWPDLALDKADMAFHRTVSALRRTLEPGLRRGNESQLLSYHHERYWLNPAGVGWCDVEQFEALLEEGHTRLHQGDAEQALQCLSQAVALYRGDYLDDCPFFGDSLYVEARRQQLRDQLVDALLALGPLYERQGQAGEASGCYRRALAVCDGDCPRADEALERVQASARIL
jgi:DNA-binding SARP family transcriptional activator/GAF domain-containing protein